MALRFYNWKIVFMEQRVAGDPAVWAEPFTRATGTEALQPAHRPLRAGRHHLQHLLRLVHLSRLSRHGGPGARHEFLQTFKEFPPRQKAARFTIDQALAKLARVPRAAPAADGRPTSWNDTPTRAAIEAFVAAVTTEGGTDFVPPAERVAVFDNDGTLWSEKPMPIQLDFTLHRMADMAAADPPCVSNNPGRRLRARPPLAGRGDGQAL